MVDVEGASPWVGKLRHLRFTNAGNGISSPLFMLACANSFLILSVFFSMVQLGSPQKL